MSKCACCSKCGEPIQEPHNGNGLCNRCDPYIEVCYCGEEITSLAEFNHHRAGETPCAAWCRACQDKLTTRLELSGRTNGLCGVCDYYGPCYPPGEVKVVDFDDIPF